MVNFSKYPPPHQPPPQPPMRGGGGAAIILLFLAGVIAVAVLAALGKAELPSGGKDSKTETQVSSAKPPKGTEPCILSAKKNNRACKKAKAYAFAKLKKDRKQFACLDKLWTGESHWNAWDVNSSSGAAGIPQALGHGKVFELGDWKKQVDWGLKYIRGRYKTPCAAWAFWQRTDPRPHPNHWY